MIHWQADMAVYLHCDPVDFRKSINGLSVMVEEAMGLSLQQQALFVFCNKRRDKLKALYWDHTGFALWYKRLEKQKFKWPKEKHFSHLTIDAEQWDWLLRGFDLKRMQPHKKMEFLAVN